MKGIAEGARKENIGIRVKCLDGSSSSIYPPRLYFPFNEHLLDEKHQRSIVRSILRGSTSRAVSLGRKKGTKTVEKRAVSIREHRSVHGATADFVAFYVALAVSSCLSNAIKSAGQINSCSSGTQNASQRRKAFICACPCTSRHDPFLCHAKSRHRIVA